jgi:hemerythrin superfamily protein
MSIANKQLGRFLRLHRTVSARNGWAGALRARLLHRDHPIAARGGSGALASAAVQKSAARTMTRRFFAAYADTASQVREEHSIDKLGQPKMTDLQKGVNIAELILTDHRAVEALFARFNGKGVSDTDKQMAAWNIIRELSIHACVEEQVFYPALKEMGADGAKYEDHCVKEHTALKKLLYELDAINADPKNSKTAPLMARIEKEVTHHVKEEESHVLPFIRKQLNHSKQIDLGNKYVEYKPLMPTRPHPDAPIGSYLGDRALAIADGLRDKVRFGTGAQATATTSKP